MDIVNICDTKVNFVTNFIKDFDAKAVNRHIMSIHILGTMHNMPKTQNLKNYTNNMTVVNLHFWKTSLASSDGDLA